MMAVLGDLSVVFVTALIGLSAYCIYHLIIHPLFLHPLRKIPRAHWTVAFPYIGNVWILLRRYQHRSNKTTYNAHLKGGPVVRLAYGELSINCVDDGIRTVYGGGWWKHDWYAKQFASYGVINMFSTVSHRPHSQKKRTISNIYSKSNVQASPQIKTNSRVILERRLLPIIQSHSDAHEVVDIHALNNAYTMDFMSAYVFGISNATNFLQNKETRDEFLHLYHSRRDYEWHSAEVSPTVRQWLDALHIDFVPGCVATANAYIADWSSRMCDASEKYLQTCADGLTSNSIGDEPVVYKHFKTGLEHIRVKDTEAGREYLPQIVDPSLILTEPNGCELMTRNEIHSEIYDHLSAGHETSGIGLTYLHWEVGQSQRLQDRLHQELQLLEPQIQWPLMSGKSRTGLNLPEPSDLDALLLLNAVIMETLRLHAPIPGTEPRVSPDVDGGSRLGAFAGIPGGVRVAAMPYTLHRNSEVFPQPERFNPDRWLTDDVEKLKEMYRWFWAFGSGGRMCIGRHLAVQGMKLVVAAIYSNWKCEIDDDEGIEEIDAYTTRPKSNKLMVRFTHR